MVTGGVEQPAEEGGGVSHLVLGVEPFEIEHRGHAMDARALAGNLQGLLGVVLGIDHEVTEPLAQRDEVAFRIDDGLRPISIATVMCRLKSLLAERRGYQT